MHSTITEENQILSKTCTKWKYKPYSVILPDKQVLMGERNITRKKTWDHASGCFETSAAV